MKILVDTPAKLKEMEKRIQGMQTFSLDLETSELNPRKGWIVSVIVGTKEDVFFVPRLVGLKPHVPTAHLSLGDQEYAKLRKRGKRRGSVNPAHVRLRGMERVMCTAKYKKQRFPLVAGPGWGFWRKAIEMVYERAEYLVFHNAKFDMSFLHQCFLHPIEHGGIPEDRVLDTMGMVHILEEAAPLGLKELSLLVLDRVQMEFDPTWTYSWWAQKAAFYGFQDGRNTWDLGVWLFRVLQEQGLWDQYLELYQALPWLAERMERQGICLDLGQMEDDYDYLTEVVERLNEELQGVGPELENPGSWQQRARALLALGLKPQDRWLNGKKPTKFRGEPLPRLSTSSDTVKDMLKTYTEGPVYEFLSLYTRYTKAAKVRSFLWSKKGSGLLGTHEKGYIYPSWNPFFTVTGRWSCSSPNLQQIPRPIEVEGRIVNPRTWFVAPSGYKLLVADYEQAEVGVVAGMSQDQDLLAAYGSGDIHAATTRKMWPGQWEAWDKSEWKAHRHLAKTALYGSSYGATAKKVAESCGVSVVIAQQVIDTLYRTFHGMAAWKRAQERYLSTQGVSTSYRGKIRRPAVLDAGNLRHYTEITEVEPGLPRLRLAALWNELRKVTSPVKKWELTKATGRQLSTVLKKLHRRGLRQGYNAIAQGTVGDAMNTIMPSLVRDWFIPIGMIHDEVIFLVKDEREEDGLKLVEKLMPFDVSGLKIRVEPHVGYSWAEAK